MFWKIYTGVLAILIFSGYGIAVFQGLSLLETVDIPITLLALAGLFGFTFRIPIFNRQIWRSVWIAIIAWDLYINLSLTDWSSGSEESLTNAAIFFALLVPQWIALFLYAYRSEPLWKERFTDYQLMTAWFLSRIWWLGRWLPPIVFVTIAWSLLRLVLSRFSKHEAWKTVADKMGLKYHQYSYLYPGTIRGKIGGYEIDINPSTGEIEVEIPDLSREWRQVIISTSPPEGPPYEDMQDFDSEDGRFKWLFKTRRAHKDVIGEISASTELHALFGEFYQRFMWSTLKFSYAYDEFSWESSRGGLTREIAVSEVEEVVGDLIRIGQKMKELDTAGKSRAVPEQSLDFDEMIRRKHQKKMKKRLKKVRKEQTASVVCQQCNTGNPQEFRFCGGCGMPLSRSS